MLDIRLRSVVKQDARQKGFTDENGCLCNISLVDAALRQVKTHTGGIFSILDISKAFDTIPHSAIGVALRRKGVPAELAKYIQEMYAGCQTSISAE